MELENIFADVAKDDEVNAVVLSGAGLAFCVGGDVKFMDLRSADPYQGRGPLRGTRRFIRNLMEVEQPIIAAVNDHAIGLGTTLALFCDISITSEEAKIGDPHLSVGLVAGDGGAVIWPLLCGIAKAKEYLMTGDLMTGIERSALVW